MSAVPPSVEGAYLGGMPPPCMASRVRVAVGVRVLFLSIYSASTALSRVLLPNCFCGCNC